MNRPNIWTIFQVWVYFFLPFLPGCPKIGEEEDGDCLFVQAFGRNSFPDEGLGKRLWTLREQADLDDLDTFAILASLDFDEGSPNRVIASAVIADYERHRDPIQSQWEVIYSIFRTNPDWYAEHQAEIDVIWPPQEGYFATDAVKLFCKVKALKRGCNRPREMAHPAMKVRALPILWKLGLNPIVTAVSPLAFWKDKLWCWDENSVQPWIRNFAAWLKRETPGRSIMVMVSLFPSLLLLVSKNVRAKLPRPCLAIRPRAA